MCRYDEFLGFHSGVLEDSVTNPWKRNHQVSSKYLGPINQRHVFVYQKNRLVKF